MWWQMLWNVQVTSFIFTKHSFIWIIYIDDLINTTKFHSHVCIFCCNRQVDDLSQRQMDQRCQRYQRQCQRAKEPNVCELCVYEPCSQFGDFKSFKPTTSKAVEIKSDKFRLWSEAILQDLYWGPAPLRASTWLASDEQKTKSFQSPGAHQL